MVGIIGNTGCGKSTFVRLIAGLIKSYSGKIIIDGDDINNKNSIKNSSQKTWNSISISRNAII